MEIRETIWVVMGINIDHPNFTRKFDKKKLVLAFNVMILFLMSDPSHVNYWQAYAASGSIVLDNVQSTYGTVALPFQVTLSNFVVGSGTNKALIVAVESSTGTVSGITYGGVALTQVISKSNIVETEFWILKNPSSGTADIVVTMSGASTVVVGAYSFFGVDQTNPIPTTITNSSTTNNPSTTIINNNAYSWLLDSVTIASTSLSNPTQTSQWNVQIASVVSGASSSAAIISPNTSTTFGWISGTVGHWAQIAIEVKSSQIMQSLSDSMTILDTISTSSSFQKSLSDSLTVADTVTASKTLQQSLSDSIPLSDSLSTTKSISKSLSDSIPLSDSLSTTKSISKSLSDSIPLSDSLSTTKIAKQSLLDSFTLSDSLTTKRIVSKSLLDSFTLSDFISTKTSSEPLSDSVGMSDSVSVSSTNNQNVPLTSTGGGNSGSVTSPSFSGSAFSEAEYPLSIDGKNYKLPSYTNSIPTTTFETGKPIELSLLAFSNRGPDSTQHVALYTNLHGSNSDISQSDTYIIYEKGQAMQVVDPHNLFAHVNINTAPVGNKLQIVFDITFAKPMDTSNIVVRMWDAYRNSVDTKILDAWQVVQSTPEVQSTHITNSSSPITQNETPDIMPSIKKWGGYSPTSISDSQLLADVGMNGTHIPSWFMKTTKWIVTNEVNQQDFLNALKYMHDNGMIK
jgi:hypothetical protein